MEFYLNGVRIEVAEVNLNFKHVPAAARFAFHFAETECIPVLFYIARQSINRFPVTPRFAARER